MQLTLGAAGFWRRAQLGSGKIGLEEFVGDQEPAVSVAVGQMMAARKPKIPHASSPRTKVAIPTVLAGSLPILQGSADSKVAEDVLPPRPIVRAKRFHIRGPPVAGSSHDGALSARSKSRRTTGLPGRSTE